MELVKNSISFLIKLVGLTHFCQKKKKKLPKHKFKHDHHEDVDKHSTITNSKKEQSNWNQRLYQ